MSALPPGGNGTRTLIVRGCAPAGGTDQGKRRASHRNQRDDAACPEPFAHHGPPQIRFSFSERSGRRRDAASVLRDLPAELGR
jgi:hypothetical protein